MFKIQNYSLINIHDNPHEHRATLNPNWSGENNVNYNFNKFIYSLIPKNPITILELGCGGGGIVKQFIDDGHIACGIDGGLAYAKFRPYAWNEIPNNLFCADIGKPFELLYDGPIKFDLIYSFECFEHIQHENIPQLMQNIKKHSHSNTHFVGGISLRKCEGHVSIYPEQWWIEQFNQIGFKTGPFKEKYRVRDLSDSIYFIGVYHETTVA